MAQLGCNELTPPAHRIPTRMFKDEETNEYRPYHTYKRKKTEATTAEAATEAATETAAAPSTETKEDDEWEYVEDRDSVEGAIYPIQGKPA